MRFADARRQASVIINNSIKFSAGGLVGCTMNTSRPRTFSINSTLTSPSLNRPTSARPNCTCKCRAISCASVGFALPVNTAIDNESNSLLCDMNLRSNWLGWKDSNLRMAGSKPAALPLGDTPAPQSRANRGARARILSAASTPSPRLELPLQGRGVKTPRHEARPPIGNLRREALGLRGRGERAEHARSRAAHVRRSRPGEPIERLRDLGRARTHDWLAVVTPARLKKGAYCDERGISCQFRALEDLPGTDTDVWPDDHVPALGQRDRGQPFADAFGPGGRTFNENRDIRTEWQREADEGLSG